MIGAQRTRSRSSPNGPSPARSSPACRSRRRSLDPSEQPRRARLRGQAGRARQWSRSSAARARLTGAPLAAPAPRRALPVERRRQLPNARGQPAAREPASPALALLAPQDEIDDAVAAADKRLLIGLLVSLLLIALVAYVGRPLDRRLPRPPRQRRERDRPRPARPPRRGPRARRVRPPRPRVQRDGRPARGAARGARRRARAPARRDRPLRRCARGDARRRPAPARDRRDGGRDDRRDGRPRRRPRRRDRPDRDALRAGRDLRAAAHAPAARASARSPSRAAASRVEQRRTAASLVAHAAIALENARLHRIVARQALVDMLTGLANRRHCEEALAERADARRALRRLGRASCSPTSTASSRSTTASATRSATACSSSSPRRCANACARSTFPPAGAARSSRSSCPGTDLEGATRLAERARRALEERTILSPDGTRIHVTVSLGVAAFPEAAVGEGLVAAADGALYEAKRTGKNRVVRARPRARQA